MGNQWSKILPKSSQARRKPQPPAHTRQQWCSRLRPRTWWFLDPREQRRVPLDSWPAMQSNRRQNRSEPCLTHSIAYRRCQSNKQDLVIDNSKGCVSWHIVFFFVIDNSCSVERSRSNLFPFSLSSSHTLFQRFSCCQIQLCLICMEILRTMSLRVQTNWAARMFVACLRANENRRCEQKRRQNNYFHAKHILTCAAKTVCGILLGSRVVNNNIIDEEGGEEKVNG